MLIHERVGTLGEGADMLAFLFLDDVVYDETDVAKVLNEDGLAVVAAAREALAAVTEWTTAVIEEALRAKLVDELGLKPRNAFGPVRVAVTGRKVSPPLFESLELLGRERSLARLDAAPGCSGAHGWTRLMSYPQGPYPGPPPANLGQPQQPWPPPQQLRVVPAAAAPAAVGRRARGRTRTRSRAPIR